MRQLWEDKNLNSENFKKAGPDHSIPGIQILN